MKNNTYYGLEFTYHRGKKEEKFYDSQNARNRVFETWKKRLNTTGYVDKQVKSVRKVEKSNG